MNTFNSRIEQYTYSNNLDIIYNYALWNAPNIVVVDLREVIFRNKTDFCEPTLDFIANNASDSQIVIFPGSTPSIPELKNTTYYVKGGGYKIFKKLLDKCSFSTIYEYINKGQKDVIYETVNLDGTLTYNDK